MKTSTYHATNLGSFAPRQHADCNGYITYHVSPRYAKATEEQLSAWANSPLRAVRAAADTELAERALRDWNA